MIYRVLNVCFWDCSVKWNERKQASKASVEGGKTHTRGE